MDREKFDYLCNGHYLKRTYCPRTNRDTYQFYDVYQDENGELLVPVGITHPRCPKKSRRMVCYQYIYPTHASLGSRKRYLVPCSGNDGEIRYAKVFLADKNARRWEPQAVGSEYHYSIGELMKLNDQEEFAIINASIDGEKLLESMTSKSIKISNKLIGEHFNSLSNEYKKTMTASPLDHQHHFVPSSFEGGRTQMMVPCFTGELNFDIDSSLIGAVYQVPADGEESYAFPAQLIAADMSGKSSGTSSGNLIIKQAKKASTPKDAKGKQPNGNTIPNDKITKRPTKVGVLDDSGNLSSKNQLAAKTELESKGDALSAKSPAGKPLQGPPKPSKTSILTKGIRSVKKGAGKIARSQFVKSTTKATKEIVTQAATAAAVSATQNIIDKASSGLSKLGKKVPSKKVALSPLPSTEAKASMGMNPDDDDDDDGDNANDGKLGDMGMRRKSPKISSIMTQNYDRMLYEKENEDDDEIPLYMGNELPSITHIPATANSPREFQLSLVPTAYGNVSSGSFAVLNDQHSSSYQSLERLGCDCNRKRKPKTNYPEGSRILYSKPGVQVVGDETQPTPTPSVTTSTAAVVPTMPSKPQIQTLTLNDVAMSNTSPANKSSPQKEQSPMKETEEEGNDEQSMNQEEQEQDSQTKQSFPPNSNATSEQTNRSMPTSVPGLYVFRFQKFPGGGTRMVSEEFTPRIGVDSTGDKDDDDDNNPPSIPQNSSIVPQTIVTQPAMSMQNTPSIPMQPMTTPSVTTTVSAVPITPPVVPTPTQVTIPSPQYVPPHMMNGMCGFPCRQPCKRLPPLAPLVCDMNSVSVSPCHVDVHSLPHTVNFNKWVLAPTNVVHNICCGVRKHLRHWCLKITSHRLSHPAHC